METKFAVENIIDSIVILEDIESGEQIFISKDSLDFEINDGDILIYKDGTFEKSIEEYNKRMETIKEKFAAVRRPK